MRRLAIFGTVLLSLVLVASAAAKAKPKPRPLVLHPRWTLVRNGGLQADGHYVLKSSPSQTTLLDEHTNQTVAVPPPPENCGILGLSGPWVVASRTTTKQSVGVTDYGVRLFSMQPMWSALISAPSNPQPRTELGAQFLAAGAHWLKYSVYVQPCNDDFPHCGSPTTEYQNIQTRQVGQAPWYQPGGTLIPDLDAPSLARTLCKPLRVPADGPLYPVPGSNEPDTPGNVTFFGRFGVATYTRYIFIERCGSKLFRRFSTRNSPVLGNASVVLSGFEGYFLPSVKPFRVPGPPGALPGTTSSLYAATDRTMFASNSSGVWEAPLPRYRPKHRHR